ncbi:MAG: hypothetical protein DHS20C06_14860 [Hyphobacterium sp.]|nr:MAG: hypothetical protein DHS20C06_14860 [Hyphobacterium sp.]
MYRKSILLVPLFLAACVTPEIPGGFEDEQSWFDARVRDGASAEAAPSSIPDKTPARSASALAHSAENVLEARDQLAREERATRPPVTDTEDYAEEAREHATPPPPID